MNDSIVKIAYCQIVDVQEIKIAQRAIDVFAQIAIVFDDPHCTLDRRLLVAGV